MAATGARKIPEEEWVFHKQTLKRLWLDEDRKLLGDNGVMEVMTEHGFDTSKSQYEARFKKWSWRKNKKREDWQQLAVMVHKQGLQKNETEVRIDGRLLSSKKVHRQITRYRPSSFNRETVVPQTHIDIAVRPPTVDVTSLILDFPFSSFELCLRIGNNPLGPEGFFEDSTIEDWCHRDYSTVSETHWQEQLRSTSALDTKYVSPDLWVQDCPAFTISKSIVPKSIIDENSLMTFSSQVFPSNFYRLVLFSLSNNFAGIGTSSVKDVLDFLQRETNKKLFQMLLQTPGYSSQAIAQNVFNGAIEVGDAECVDLLLRDKFTNIDINKQLCPAEGRMFTPVKRASSLLQKGVIEVLLKNHADVNRTGSYQPVQEWGALDCALFCSAAGFDCGVEDQNRLRMQIGIMLLEGGAKLSSSFLTSLMHHGPRHLIKYTLAVENHEIIIEWSERGGLCRTIESIDEEQIAIRVVQAVVEIGVDLNHCIDGECMDRDTGLKAVDVAARRGSLALLEVILSFGASLTGHTLPCAIANGEMNLVQWLLDRGADLRSIAPYKDRSLSTSFPGSHGFVSSFVTALAAAIRLQDAQLVKLLIGLGVLETLSDQAHLSAAAIAASEVGNIPFLERLIASGVELDPTALGRGLFNAVQDGRDDVANFLINAGADINITYCLNNRGKPLSEALKRSNIAMVYSLLAVDKYVSNGDDAHTFAGRMGNRSVIEALIFNGSNVNEMDALNVALENEDLGLAEFLLDVGADINRAVCGRSALAVAAQKGDLGMARFLLRRGADPDDSKALGMALQQNKGLFYLLLEEHIARYSKLRKGFGSNVLASAVKAGDKGLIRELLRKGVDASTMIQEKCKEYGDEAFHSYYLQITPFGLAIWSYRDHFAECIEIFLQRGCHPNDVVSSFIPTYQRVTHNRVTAFLSAIGTRNVAKVELLIEHGADVNFAARGPIKRTPLQRGAETGSIEIVELLLSHGATVNAPAAHNGGGTALQLAAIGGYIQIVCILLSHEADVNAPAAKMQGRTALEGAAEHGRLDTVSLLLSAGAGSARHERKEFTNAISLAKKNGHLAVCDLLEDHLKQGGQAGEPMML